MKSSWKEKLADLVEYPVAWRRSLDHYTSLAIGGPAEAVVKVEKKRELRPLLTFLAEEKLPWRVLGRGTNVLARDEGFAGVILLLGSEFQAIGGPGSAEGGKKSVHVGGGCGLGKFCRQCADWGLSGMEFGCGIPGTIGGAVIMNAGAWGSDMSSVVASVTLTTAEGEEMLAGKALDFSYRNWPGFAGYQATAVVSAVELALQEDEPAAIRERGRILQERRKSAQPICHANAGSFFKNPQNDSAGRLIEASGLKGVAVGGAMVSPQHGNFLVNRGGATAGDMHSLMKMVQERVQSDNGIYLEPEVHFI